MSDEQVADAKPKKERSPSFPFISLKRAVERTEALHVNHKREAARLAAVAPTWNYGTKSSGLLQTVAALKQFGLIEDLGSGDDRKVQITDLGRRIILDQRPGAREEAIQEAARAPRLMAEYIAKWVPDRPSDAHCISELELDRGFGADAARAFLRIFDETVAYAKLEEDGGAQSEDEFAPAPEPTEEERPPSDARNDFRDIFHGLMPPIGPKPLGERLQVNNNANRITVAASLITQDEVDTLIRILEVNKLVLPAPSHSAPLPPPPPPPPPATGASGRGAVNLD